MRAPPGIRPEEEVYAVGGGGYLPPVAATQGGGSHSDTPRVGRIWFVGAAMVVTGADPPVVRHGGGHGV